MEGKISRTRDAKTRKGFEILTVKEGATSTTLPAAAGPPSAGRR
jgi:hypothetical protein